MNVIAVVHRKGGVGKTTTAVNVAAFLGPRTLLIDLDTQRNASLHLGVRLGLDQPSPAYRVLASARPLVEEAIETGYGFDLLPATSDLDEAVDKMRRAIGGRGKWVLKEALDEVPPGRWENVIIDCPPSVGDLANAALIAARWVVIPMVLQSLPYEGLLEVVELIKSVRRYENPELEVGAVFSTLLDDNTILEATVRERVETLLGESMLPLRIRRNTALASAAEAGRPVRFYDPKCNGAIDYQALVEELKRLKVLS